MQQQTIQRPAELEGLGLFTGESVKVRFLPAEPDTGRVFVRRDSGREVHIPAHVGSVAKRGRRTSLRNGTLSIETTEHCLAAVSGLGIDNLRIELDGGELPSFDGSSIRFVETLAGAGLTGQQVERRTLRVTAPVVVHEGDAMLAALPGEGDGLHIIYELDYANHPAIGRQVFSVEIAPEQFVRELAPARTFLTEDEARQFRASGMGAHLTTSDLLVFGPEGPVDNEARFPNEPVRHKILDLVGDLALVGRPVAGRIVACKSGHNLNHALVRRLLELADRQETSARAGDAPAMDIRKIAQILPHRYPFLLVDRVVHMDADRRAVGIKNVTYNELFFQGHYPGQPIMPGVLIVEALAQLSGLLLSQKLEHTGKLAVLLSMDRVKMRRPVVPGDQLVLVAETIRVKSRTGHVKCEALVGDKLAAEAVIKFMLVDAEPV